MDIDTFTICRVGTGRDPKGNVVVWAAAEPWAALIAFVLNWKELEGTWRSRRPGTRHPDPSSCSLVVRQTCEKYFHTIVPFASLRHDLAESAMSGMKTLNVERPDVLIGTVPVERRRGRDQLVRVSAFTWETRLRIFRVAKNQRHCPMIRGEKKKGIAMSTMMTPIREDRDKTVMEVKPITSVWFSATGKLLASRRVSGLTPEERQKVKAGEVVLVYANQGHDGRTDFGYRQAVWSGGTIRTRKPSAAVLEAWFRQGLGPTAGARTS